MSTDPDLAVDPAALHRAADILDAVATSLDGAAPDLRRSPDAGASSDELATALTTLAEATSGLGRHVASLAEVTRGDADDYAATDSSVAGAWQQRRSGLTP